MGKCHRLQCYVIGKTPDCNAFNQFRNVRQVRNRSIGTGIVRIHCGFLESRQDTSFSVYWWKNAGLHCKIANMTDNWCVCRRQVTLLQPSRNWIKPTTIYEVNYLTVWWSRQFDDLLLSNWWKRRQRRCLPGGDDRPRSCCSRRTNLGHFILEKCGKIFSCELCWQI